ncbi:hypothetical protein [Caldisalinibacter kiritimatiensis]|uniref:Uncharacterized protein n=1 Tax=Caldisalinibacter kiritimatiensis TaxID=1304284 RepID=R1CH60_9FIRM|nr:hypothetical protein [Caldisalinibacter kiritimatiensis]EOD01630.1 hypothetical protein L21TH_0292 [Caldisalinibacter kiritimatiensis]
MIRIVISKKIYFYVKIDELIEALADLSNEYVTLKEAIDIIIKI